MKKTLVYVAILAIMGFGVYWFFFRNSDNLYQSKDADFGFRDTAAIGKIFLAETDGQSILLERDKNNSWTVNKTFPAMRIQVLNILTCLNKQTALVPVPERDYERVIKLLAGLGVKVEIYNREGKKVRCFYVAGQGPNYHGSYMLMEGSQQPYLVEIRGFEGYLTPRYSTDIADWRSRVIFDAADQEIKSFSVNYPEEPLNSFTIDNSVSPATLKIDPELSATMKDVHQGRVNVFLTLFKNVNAEGFLDGVEHLDSVIAHSKLRAHVSLQLKSGAEKKLDFYWIDEKDQFENLRDQTATDPTQRPTDVERLYMVDLLAKDTVLVQRLTFEKFFRRAYEFFLSAPDPARTKPALKGPMNTKEAPIQYVK
jgi:hypothetical protein